MTQKIAVVGRGSPAGPRWFVSKNPGFVSEVTPERYPDVAGNRAPFLRVAFKSEGKASTHVGEGHLGSRNKTNSDTNANRHYGVYFVIDPGPVPEGGYKNDSEAPEDDKGQAHEDWVRTAEEKARDRKIIDHLRSIYAYRHSPQDNQYRVTSRLTELNWDPAEIRVYVESMVIPGLNRPMGRPPVGAPEPEENKGEERPAAKAPPMGVPVKRRSVPA